MVGLSGWGLGRLWLTGYGTDDVAIAWEKGWGAEVWGK